MKRSKYSGVGTGTIVLLIGLFLLSTTNYSWGGEKGSPFIEGELLVQHKAGVSEEKIADEIGATGAVSIDEIPQIRVKRIKMPAQALEIVQERLAKNPHIKFVENNYIVEASALPNDLNYPSEWHLPVISAPAGWDISKGSSAVAIAIIDTGVDPTHPDLAGKLIPGYNVYAGNTDTHDVYGHGTKVAGSAAALSNNSIGVVGVAWQNPIMPLVVTNSTGAASYFDIANAITYAADRGVRVMNISFGGDYTTATLQNAVNYAWNKGSVIFASAANYSTNTPYYPAACTNVVAVGATNASDSLASFSNYGDWVDITAPGESILTTTNGGGYGYVSGTSFSSPIAAGLGALIFSVNPSLTNAQMVDIIRQNTDDLGTPGFDPYFGYGRINVYKALMAARNNVPQPDTTPPSAAITSPPSGSTISGTVAVNVSASDNVGVTRVDFYVNGALFATDNTAPYAFSWDTTKYADGSYSLVAYAYDSAGNIGKSTQITVTVKNFVDTTPPAVSITSPSNGSTITGTAAVNVSASDNVGVSKVDLYVNGALFATGNTGSNSFSWNTTKYADGSYSLIAYAYDSAGNIGKSTQITVTVKNFIDTTPPAVSITSPSNGSSIRATAAVNVSASDNVGVSRVDLYVNGALFATDIAAPYSFSWDTTKYADGSYSLMAYAYDSAGNIGKSTQITVTVKNFVDTTPPTVSITSPSNGSSISGRKLAVSVTASDNTGVSKTELYIDGVLRSAVSGNSLSFKWDSLKLSSGTHVISAKAYDGTGNVGTASINVYK